MDAGHRAARRYMDRFRTRFRLASAQDVVVCKFEGFDRGARPVLLSHVSFTWKLRGHDEGLRVRLRAYKAIHIATWMPPKVFTFKLAMTCLPQAITERPLPSMGRHRRAECVARGLPRRQEVR